MKRTVFIGIIAAALLSFVPTQAQTEPPVDTVQDESSTTVPSDANITVPVDPEGTVAPPTAPIEPATTPAPPTTVDPTPTTTVLPTTSTVDINDPVARNGCNAQVWDPDKRIQPEELTGAIASLTARGADVHVRVESTTDGGADERMAQLERTCPGWFVNNDRAPKLLTLIVLPDDRQTGIYYGSEWYTLASSWKSIQESSMNPRFREGDFTGGIADGLSAMDRVFRGSYSPPYSAPTSNYNFSSNNHDRGSGGVIFLIFLLFAGVFGLNYLVYLSKGDGEGFGSYMASQRSSGNNNSWGSSSSSSFSSSSHSSSSSSSSSSGSSGGSSGGGSSSW
jgi:uncharacterized membrane protein YgcG